jgi:hypothetical protein
LGKTNKYAKVLFIHESDNRAPDGRLGVIHARACGNEARCRGNKYIYTSLVYESLPHSEVIGMLNR